MRPIKGGLVIAKKVMAWDIAQDKIIIMLKLRCKRNPRFKIKNATNARTVWEILAEFKSRESDMLNFIYKKLHEITLTGCDNDS